MGEISLMRNMPAACEGTILDEVRQTGRETIYKTIKKAKSVLWHTDYDMLFMVLDIVYIKRFLIL